LQLAVIFVAAAGIAIYGMGFKSSEGQAAEADQEAMADSRADIIEIDSMKAFGELERPKVPFLHDAHADALDKEKKDCSECHPSEGNRLSPRFKRPLSSKDIGKSEFMDLYHSNCLGCHKERTGAGLIAGPVEECGHCHISRPSIQSIRQPFGLDKSLHYRHIKSLDSKCESCHHQYDEAQKALVYIKDTAESCRYCHGLEKVENRMPMQLASHLACIDCHKKKKAQKSAAGPINCGGCHDPSKQKMIQSIAPVPRIERNQPDLIYIKKGSKDPYMNLDTYLDPKMARVPFDHNYHEEANESCRSCHHAELTSCNNCHTLAGSEKGEGVTLEQAMHQSDSDKSCIGCHGQRIKETQCAGCHLFLSENQPGKTGTCLKCHKGPSPDDLPPSALSENTISATMVSLSPTTQPETFNGTDIPEKVVIKALTDKYEMVTLPHLKMIDAIWQKIKKSRLAGRFHGQQDTLCQGCHHNSPVSKKPPRCGSCHGKPFNEKDPYKPGLMAAYHGQCMGCHNEMKIAKPASVDCTGCHAEKKG